MSVTDGEQGAWLVDSDGINFQKAFNVKPLDTNGAGDVFCGAMIYASMMNLRSDYRLRFASAAAAIKFCIIGKRYALTNLKKIESFIEQNS